MQLSSSSSGKNWTIGIIFFACLAAVLPARGNKESDFRPAEGKESWAHRYDISELPAGKYNLIIEGKDRAGNASTAGPFNVFVDPLSDLPVTGVSNPTPGMRVGGVLNIVGTCVDDDGVGHVEVRLDDGDFVQATGTGYWSYTLDVSAVPDGEHRVTAQGVDVNGKAGDPVSVAFQLDTIKPLVRMSSHESGALVSGQVNLAGSVEDANGVRSLAWSTDDRKTWNELPVKQARNRTSAPFELKVDTRKLGDGPHVYWFKGLDRTGSEGYLAFLLFVDNTGPALEILKPAPEEKVSGRTVVVGKVAEQLGVQSLAYEGGDGNTGTIELTPGDPYWTCVLDFSRTKGSAARVTFTVIDRVGNRTARQVSFPLLDDKADLAVVTLRSPVAEGRYGTEALLSGMVRDDDGVKGVQYSLDGGAPVLVPGSETFAVPLSGLLPGRHKLSVRGVDLNDRPGGEQVVEFTALGTPPEVTLESAAGREGVVPFRPGLEVNRLDGVVLAGRVATAGRIQGLELSLNGGAPAKLPAPKTAGKGTRQPDGAGGTSFELRLPPDLPFGLLPFTVRATDELGQVGELKSLLRVSNLSRRNIEPGIYFADSRLQPDGTVLLPGPEPLSGIFAEEEIDSVGLEPDTGLVSVTAEGDRLVVAPQKAGISEPVRIRVVSTRRHVFLSDAFRFVTDGGKPEVAITTPRSGEWFARGLEVTGTVSDATGIAALEYSLDGMKSWAPVDRPADGDGSRAADGFRFQPPLEALPDGLVHLAVRATDGAGNSAFAQVALLKDSAPPEVTIVAPAAGEEIFGRLLLAGSVKDGGAVARLELSLDGRDFTALPGTGSFQADLDPAALPAALQRLAVRATDRAGNSATAEVRLRLASTPPAAAPPGAAKDTVKPVVELLWPPKEARLHGRVAFIGRASDDRGLKRLAFDAGGGRKGEVELTAGSPYWAKELDFGDLKGAKPAVSFTAEDLSGNRAELRLAAPVDPASDLPVVEIARPADKGQVEGGAGLALCGAVRDDEGVSRILWSLDGGAEQELAGAEAFAVPLADLPAGPHRLTVRAVDSGGVAGPKKEVSFTVAGPAPAVLITGVRRGGESRDFSAGMRLGVDKATVLVGTALFPNPQKSVEASVQGGPARALSLKKGSRPGEMTFDLPLSPELPYGRVEVRFSATDTLGRRGETLAVFYRVDEGPAGADIEGISFLDSRIEAGGTVLLRPGDTLAGIFNGRPIREVRLEPESGFLSAAFDDRYLAVTAGGEGLQEGVRLHLTTIDGDTFRSDPYTFHVDAAAPRLEVSSPATGDWAGGRIVLKGTAADPNGIRRVEYALQGGGPAGPEPAFLPVEAGQPLEGGFAFEAPLDLAALPDGDVALTVRATDAAGRASESTLRFMKDTVGPAVALLTPLQGDAVNGRITVTGTVADEGRVERVEFSDDGSTFTPVEGTGVFTLPLDLSRYPVLPEAFTFRATDRGGNTTLFTPTLNVQQATDIPVVQIQIPQEGETLRNDFIISGMVFDDDGVGSISYRIDEGEFVPLPGSNGFSIPVAITDIADNGHTIEVKAEDLNAVPSEARTSTFRISKAEPTAKITAPPIDLTARDLITLEGEAADRNGIEEVFVSYDNGRTFDRCEGQEKWTYRLDTRILKDGTYSVLVRPVDAYGTEGLYTTLLNIDNAGPQIILDTPADGVAVTGSLPLDGRAWDNIRLTALKATLQPLGGGAAAGGTGPETPPPAAAAAAATFDVPHEEIFSLDIDLTPFPPGWYDLTLVAEDLASNVTKVSRNLLVQGKEEVNRVDVWFPLNGDRLTGPFSLSGKLESAEKPQVVGFTIDGQEVGTIPVNGNGWFSLVLGPDQVGDGMHTVEIQARLSDQVTLRSEPRRFEYRRLGPWMRIASHSLGDFVSSRPFIQGEAGWLAAPSAAAEDDKAAQAQARKEEKARGLVRVEVSLDNGKTFQEAQGKEKWRFRLETQEHPDGPVRLITRAVFANGESALDRTILILDDTAPRVTLLDPKEGSRFNGTVPMLGTAQDENGVEGVGVAIRKGDKAAYEVPSFIQGLYLDLHGLGATWYDAGAGLTFFDDNVKLQAQVGYAPEGRFSGTTIGMKLLANLAHVPFGYFLGPDWDWLSASLAVGANFSYITNTEGADASGEGLILGAVVGQLEFPIVKVRDWDLFNTWSLYTEYQLWFISSDVSAGLLSRLAFGARIGLF